MSAIVGRKAETLTVSPFISQPMFWPVALLRQITSALPSPSKSPTPLISQFVSAIVGRKADTETVSPFINQPIFWPGAVVPQDHVGFAVAVEVANASNVPVRVGNRRQERGETTVNPFISQPIF